MDKPQAFARRARLSMQVHKNQASIWLHTSITTSDGLSAGHIMAKPHMTCCSRNYCVSIKEKLGLPASVQDVQTEFKTLICSPICDDLSSEADNKTGIPAPCGWPGQLLLGQHCPGQRLAVPVCGGHTGCCATAACQASAHGAACSTSSSPGQSPQPLLPPADGQDTHAGHQS